MSALASELGLQKSTVHRILQTMAEMGWVTQEEGTGRYRASLKTWELGSAIIGEHPIKRAAAPFLHELGKLTGETVSLTILSGLDVLYLDKIVSPRPMRFTTRAGSRVPAPLTAGGRAMLAFEPDARALVEEVAALEFNSRDFDVEQFMAELEQIRREGFATSSFTPGVISIAGAIMAHDGRAAAALSVSAPAERLGGKKKAEIIEAVKSVCARMAELVGRI